MNEKSPHHTDCSSSSVTPVMNSIAAVAARIQDRADQLTSECATLQLVLSELDDAKKKLKQESKKNHLIRTKLLQSTGERHSVELELYKHQEKNQNLEKEIFKIREEKNVLEKQIESVTAHGERMAQNIYSTHEVRIELYRREKESFIHRVESKRRKRERKLDQLALKTEMYREEACTMHQQRIQLRDDIQRMDIQEMEEDKEITNLATAIRDAITKRAQLRLKFVDVNKKYDNAVQMNINIRDEPYTELPTCSL